MFCSKLSLKHSVGRSFEEPFHLPRVSALLGLAGIPAADAFTHGNRQANKGENDGWPHSLQKQPRTPTGERERERERDRLSFQFRATISTRPAGKWGTNTGPYGPNHVVEARP